MTPMQIFFWFIAILGNLFALFLYQSYQSVSAVVLGVFTLLYTFIGLYDVFISQRNLNRLYPVVAYIRYFLESFRVEIQQYFIANDTEEKPFNREQRTLVYQRSKNISDTIAFGTQRDLMEPNYLSIWHSMQPAHVTDEVKRITIGGLACKQPYSASYLNISALSFGALSANAIEALSLGAYKGQFYLNTGEGAVSPYHLKHQSDLVWQIGTGLFGCRNEQGEFDDHKFQTTAQLVNVKMIEIKLSQGAKPGHGGVLPKAKITDEIATIRGISKDKDCISPSVNPECTTPKKLLSFIQRLRELSDGKPIGIKLCIGNPAEFLSLCKGMLSTNIYPDFITVDGSEGGTGAAPVEFSNRLGMTCIEGTYFVHNALVGLGLRDNIRLISSGKTASSFEILNKIAFGADIVNSARTMMMALGCVQSRHCNTNKCPTGIATQDPIRSKAVDVEAKSERVKNFHHNTLKSFYELVGSMGINDPRKLTPNMIKRRTINGLFISGGSLVAPLQSKAILNNQCNSIWTDWWALANDESFYVSDDVIIWPIEVMNKKSAAHFSENSH